MKNLQEKFASVKASMEMEGFIITKEIEEIILKAAKGGISEEE